MEDFTTGSFNSPSPSTYLDSPCRGLILQRIKLDLLRSPLASGKRLHSTLRELSQTNAVPDTRFSDGMRRPVSGGMRYAPNVRRAQGTKKRRPAMKKTSTVRVNGNMIFKGHRLTIGLDLGDRWSFYCVLDEAGQSILEQKLPTTPEAMKQTFGKIPRSLTALETGTHSPWVSRLLSELGHKVIVAPAQKVQLSTKSNRKDDRRDARTLARLARIDPELLGPVRHRSVQAQIHLTVIRARAELVSARTALVNAARGLVKSYGERLPKCGT